VSRPRYYARALPSKLTLAAVGIATAFAVVIMTVRNERAPLVLGQQMADANAAEAARLASGDTGPSPMPGGDYDKEAGDFDLAAIVEKPLDKDLQAVVRAFETWPPEKRAEGRRHISMDDQYTLIHFARRSSVFALREKSVERCREGLLALAMIDERRIDPRDASWAAGLLAHAIRSVRADRERLAVRVAPLATSGMAQILKQVDSGSNLSDWGYEQIETKSGGIGLVRTDGERFEPTIDMTGLALRLAAAVQRSRYTAEPQIAVEVPAVWFEKSHRSDAEELLKTARGAISVTGKLRRAAMADPSTQQFTEWVVEMPDAEDAATLVRYVGVDGRRDSRFAAGVASGRLFSLLVAGSFVDGVAPFESAESLAAMARETRVWLDAENR